MNSNIRALLSTRPLKHMIVARLIAGLPLVGIGAMHLAGAAPMRPILEAAGIPMPGLNAALAPLMEILAGALLLSGTAVRVGAVIAAISMAVALYAHAVADWQDEPPVVLPLAVLLAALYVLVRGAGAWSVDWSLQRAQQTRSTI